MSNDAVLIARRVQASVLQTEHNTLADVEDMCTGTVAKLERYAPILRLIAKRKAVLRAQINALMKGTP